MKNRRKRMLGILLLVGILAAFFIYNYTFNKSHRNIADEKATVFLSASELQEAFVKDESVATTEYLDKVIQTQGEITAIESNEVTLNNGVLVDFGMTETPEFEQGKLITIKGRCIGFDELLEVVKIDQATFIEKTN